MCYKCTSYGYDDQFHQELKYCLEYNDRAGLKRLFGSVAKPNRRQLVPFMWQKLTESQLELLLDYDFLDTLDLPIVIGNDHLHLYKRIPLSMDSRHFWFTVGYPKCLRYFLDNMTGPLINPEEGQQRGIPRDSMMLLLFHPNRKLLGLKDRLKPFSSTIYFLSIHSDDPHIFADETILSTYLYNGWTGLLPKPTNYFTFALDRLYQDKSPDLFRLTKHRFTPACFINAGVVARMMNRFVDVPVELQEYLAVLRFDRRQDVQLPISRTLSPRQKVQADSYRKIIVALLESRT